MNGAAITTTSDCSNRSGRRSRPQTSTPCGASGIDSISTASTFISKPMRPPRDLLPDLPVPDDADSPAGDLQTRPEMRSVARPAAGALSCSKRCTPRVNASSMAKVCSAMTRACAPRELVIDDVALHDLWDRAEHLHAGARDLDPLELLRGLELLQIRPAVHHVGVHDLPRDLVSGLRPRPSAHPADRPAGRSTGRPSGSSTAASRSIPSLRDEGMVPRARTAASDGGGGSSPRLQSGARCERLARSSPCRSARTDE